MLVDNPIHISVTSRRTLEDKLEAKDQACSKFRRNTASCVAGPDPEYPENLESGPEVRQVGHTPTGRQVLVRNASG
jgi:hypothetical protein